VKPPVSSSPTSGPTRHSLRGNRTRTGTATAVRSGPGYQDLGFRPSTRGFRTWISGPGFQALGIWLSGPGFQDLNASFRTWISGPGFQALGIWLSGPGFQDLENSPSYGRLIFFPSLFSASSGHRQTKKKSRRGEPASAF